MPIALTLPLVLNAVRALVQYRDRVDRVLSLATAAEGLPFALPAVPADLVPFREEMRACFRLDPGRTVLAVHGLDELFARWDKQLSSGQNVTDPVLQRAGEDCLEVYRRLVNIGPFLLQPQLRDPAMLAPYASSGPGHDISLAWFVVESDRLSRNSALTRLILVTADTLLEFLGQNASSFIATPRTRSVIEELIDQFAVKQDFDDESAQDLFRSLLGATLTTVLDHPEILPDQPALVALYGALNDVRKARKQSGGSDAKANDILLQLFGAGGLERVTRAYLVRAADGGLLQGQGVTGVTGAAVGAALKEIVAQADQNGGRFTGIFASESGRQRILEAIVEVQAGRAAGILDRKAADGTPLTVAVLRALAASVADAAGKHSLFSGLATGEVVGDLYAVALSAAAGNAGSVAAQLDVSTTVAGLVAALAENLSATPLGTAFDDAAQRKLLSSALGVLARHAGALSGNQAFAAPVLAAAVEAAAAGAADGFGHEDLEAVLEAALLAVADNATLAGLPQAQATAVRVLSDAVAGAPLSALRRPAARRQLLLSVLAAVDASPKVWAGAASAQQLKGLVGAVVEVLSQGKANQLLSDTTLVSAFDVLVRAIGGRARDLLAGKGTPQDLAAFLHRALDVIDQQLGRRVTLADIPAALQHAAIAYLRAPFIVATAPQATVDALLDGLRQWLEER